MIDPSFLEKQGLICRHDYTNDKNSAIIIYKTLEYRLLNIITDKELNIDILQKLKANVGILNFEIKENSNPEYVKALKYSGLKVRFLSREKDLQKLSELRLKYFDITLIEQFFEKTKDNFFEEASKYLNFKVDKDSSIVQNGITQTKTNKFILSQGKIFLSKAAFKMNISTPAFQQNVMPLIDNEDFWSEMDSFYIYKENFLKI